MICISINQESRRLALADMLNASRFGDLLEIRLDRFGKAPDLGELLAARPKPVIMACRRVQDGGFWEGSEAERQAVLRQCIVGKADYVEIELDIADAIRPFPPAKRLISYTNLQETPADLAQIYDEARTKKPDVIKLVTLARTPEEAWPLVQILARATVPTVVVGLGKPGVMLSVLSQKLKAPWVYAALERGMEAYPGQVVVDDLEQVYHFSSLQPTTRLIGVTGFTERELISVASLNAVFERIEAAIRCLPIAVGDVKVFRKIIDATKLMGVVIDPANQGRLLEIEPELHGVAKSLRAVDLLIQKNDAWHGVHVASQAWTEALTTAMQKQFNPTAPFKDRFVMLVGVNTPAKVLAKEVQAGGGNAIIASTKRKEAAALAAEVGCRFIAHEALYSTNHDVLVLCDQESVEGRDLNLRPSYLKPGMLVMDLSAGVRETPLLREARARSCAIVNPLELLMQLLQLQTQRLTGKSVPREILQKAIPERFLQED